MFLGAREVGGTKGTPYTVDVAMELDVSNLLSFNLRLALASRLDLLTRGPNKASTLLQTIDVLCV